MCALSRMHFENSLTLSASRYAGRANGGNNWESVEPDSNAKMPENEYAKRFEFAGLHLVALLEEKRSASSLHGIRSSAYYYYQAGELGDEEDHCSIETEDSIELYKRKRLVASQRQDEETTRWSTRRPRLKASAPIQAQGCSSAFDKLPSCHLSHR
jgi:hypothetical protein